GALHGIFLARLDDLAGAGLVTLMLSQVVTQYLLRPTQQILLAPEQQSIELLRSLVAAVTERLNACSASAPPSALSIRLSKRTCRKLVAKASTACISCASSLRLAWFCIVASTSASWLAC